MSSKLNLYKVESELYLNYLLGYSPNQTSLVSIPEKEWEKFTQEFGYKHNSLGIYLPRSQKAFIRDDNPLSLFHEYFGHGLYCEYSLLGRELVNLEKKLLEDEKEEFKDKQFSLNDLNEYRQKNQDFNQLQYLKNEYQMQYELFAIWSEYFLSKRLELEEDFCKKYSFISEDQTHINSIISFSEKYGDLATFYAQGMAKITTIDRVKNLLTEIFGEENINKSRLILLSGSKKPYSDIDLVASSGYIQSCNSDWIDLGVFEEKDFEKRISLFECQLTHPIIAGDYISGDYYYFQSIKSKLQTQEITSEAIEHNLKKSKQEKEASEKTNNPKLKQIYSDYSKTYFAMSHALKEGIRLFTKEALLDYSKNCLKLN